MLVRNVYRIYQHASVNIYILVLDNLMYINISWLKANLLHIPKVISAPFKISQASKQTPSKREPPQPSPPAGRSTTAQYSENYGAVSELF